MIIKTRKEAKVAEGDNWKSERLLLKKDNMGFSFHITTMKANSTTKMQYLNHLESVYCIKGEGFIIDLEDNKKHPVTPGTIYALDQHDQHILEAVTEMELACVFNPPCSGDEVHNEQGAYDL